MLTLIAAFFLGLIFGSFFNVVIARLPRMIESEWLWQCQEQARALGWTAPPESPPQTNRLNLLRPASHCLQCATPIGWRHNIPVLSYLFLRGQCRACGQAISWHYPVVEVLTGIWFVWAIAWWGVGISALAWVVFGSALIVLAVIDAQTQYLPDNITQPLCWAGLLAAALDWIPVDLFNALMGAVAGYLMVWSVAQLFKLLTKKEGMGQGDFKLLAAMGAWLGWQNLSPLLLLASLLGITHGLLHRKLKPQEAPHFPFGPSLCLAAFAVLLWGRGQPVGLIF